MKMKINNERTWCHPRVLAGVTAPLWMCRIGSLTTGSMSISVVHASDERGDTDDGCKETTFGHVYLEGEGVGGGWLGSNMLESVSRGG
jgi:hypothetical protein